MCRSVGKGGAGAQHGFIRLLSTKYCRSHRSLLPFTSPYSVPILSPFFALRKFCTTIFPSADVNLDVIYSFVFARNRRLKAGRRHRAGTCAVYRIIVVVSVSFLSMFLFNFSVPFGIHFFVFFYAIIFENSQLSYKKAKLHPPFFYKRG